MTTISFFVTGTPVAQPKHGSRGFIVKDNLGRPMRGPSGNLIISSYSFDPGTADGWKAQIAAAARPVAPLTPIVGPVQCDCTFYLPRPMSHYGTGKNLGKLKASAPRYCEKKPDVDNALKAVWDTLTKERFWLDDCQIVKTWTEKLYEIPPTIKPGVQLTIIPLENKTDTDAARHVFAEQKELLSV